MHTPHHQPRVVLSVPRHHGDDREPGPWWRPLNPAAPRDLAWVKCPCGRMALLADHEVHADGHVTPSVVCPEACGWHDHIRLLDW